MPTVPNVPTGPALSATAIMLAEPAPAAHPTKEQVRAYMHERGCAHRPPPSPDEIRRQLGWGCASGGARQMPSQSASQLTSPMQCGNAFFVPSSEQFPLFFPAHVAQLSALLAVEWMCVATGVNRLR